MLCLPSPQDFSFYGNKLFQSEFIQILSPGASLLTTLLWTLLNSGCALIGCRHITRAPQPGSDTSVVSIAQHIHAGAYSSDCGHVHLMLCL